MNYIINKINKIGCYVQTKPAKTIKEVKEITGADVICNFQFFDMKTGSPALVLKINKQVLSNDGTNYYGYAWNNNDTKLIFTTASNMNMYDNFAGAVCVVKDKKVFVPSYASAWDGVRGRTCIGIREDGSIAIYCWKDGTSGACTFKQLGQTMLSLGCINAVAFDGGGSTQLICPGGSVSTSRAIYNFLWFKEDALQSDCPFKEPSSLVKQGSKGIAAKWVQWHLNILGYNLVIDGSFGPKSVAALRKFQTDYNIDVDGICGAQTRKKLKEILNKKKVEFGDICPYEEPTILLRRNSRGEHVRWLQWHLNKAGSDLEIDGIFGPLTEAALIKFQKEVRIMPDAICGPQTIMYLKRVLNPNEKIKTANLEKFLSYCEDHIGDVYIYGAQGQDASDELVDWSAKYFPNVTNSKRVARIKKYIKDNPKNIFTGNTLKAFDCSGFVLCALDESGFKFPDTTAAGIYFNLAIPITKEQLQPGDIVLTDGLDHIGIIGKDNCVICAEGSDIGVVKTNSVNDRKCESIFGTKYGAQDYYYRSNWTKFARLKVFND